MKVKFEKPVKAQCGKVAKVCAVPSTVQFISTTSGLLSCRLHSLELCPGFHQGPDHQCRLFQTFD